MGVRLQILGSHSLPRMTVQSQGIASRVDTLLRLDCRSNLKQLSLLHGKQVFHPLAEGRTCEIVARLRMNLVKRGQQTCRELTVFY